MSQTFKYEHIQQLTRYLEKHAKGEPVSIEMLHDRMIIHGKTAKQDHFKITICNSHADYKPRISFEDKLESFLKEREDGKN